MGRGSRRQREHGQEELQRYHFLTYGVDLVCCIYHKPRAFGESSSEESSSSSSSDDSDSDSGVPPKRHEHSHNEINGDGACPRHARRQKKDQRKRKPSPNAYERMPDYGKKKDVKTKPTDGGASAS